MIQTPRLIFDKTVHAHFEKLGWLLMEQQINAFLTYTLVVNRHPRSDSLAEERKKSLDAKS